MRAQREALIAADAIVLVIGAREQQLRTGRAQLSLLLDELLLPSQPVPRERKRRLPIPTPVATPVEGVRDEEVALPWRT